MKTKNFLNILITGANGFIGNAVMQELLQKNNSNNLINIIELSSKVSTNICNNFPRENVIFLSHNNYNFDENYLFNNGCENVEVILHIGAFTPKFTADANNINLCSKNINNTLNLINSKLPNLKKIIYISTLDVYAETNEIISENTLTNPISLYGWSKLYSEKIIENFAQQHNLLYQILRLGHVFGEGEEKYKKILPLTIKNVLTNNDINIFGNGEDIRTFIYIKDVAKAIVNAIFLKEHNVINNIINIVGEQQISINDLVKKINEISWKICKKQSKINYVEVANQINRNLIFDNTKLKQILLPNYNLTPLEKGLENEILYFNNLYNVYTKI